MLKGSLRFRTRTAAFHFLATCLLAVLAGSLVLLVWYPGPFREISGGWNLLALLLVIDVVLGPMLTFVLANSQKSRRELASDIGLVVVLQLAALSYGLWTVFVARPVYVVHEVDRFQVITPADIDPMDMEHVALGFRSLPLWGPRVIGVRSAKDEQEKLHSLDLALAGKDVAKRADWWVEMDERHRPIMETRGLAPEQLESLPGYDVAVLERLLQSKNLQRNQVWIFPLVARNTDWSIVIDKRSLGLVGYIRVDTLQ